MSLSIIYGKFYVEFFRPYMDLNLTRMISHEYTNFIRNHAECNGTKKFQHFTCKKHVVPLNSKKMQKISA